MLIREKRRGQFIYLFIRLFIYSFIFLFIASKEAYPIVRQLQKNNDQKSAREISKIREKQILGPQNSPSPWSLK